jgi:hypothetical protein
MFVALVDSRPPWEPEPSPEPRRRRSLDIPWRAIRILATVVALLGLAGAVSGLAGYGILLVAVTYGAWELDRAAGYWLGLTEHRQ